MLRHRGARVLRTSAAAAIRRTRRGQPESEPQSPKRIWQRNGGKGMKTKLSPSPFLCLHSFAQNSAVPLPSSHRHRAARCQLPPSACRIRWPMLHRCGARRRFGVPPLGGERHGYARRDNLAVALFFTSRRLKPGLQTKDCARSACQSPPSYRIRWPHAAPFRCSGSPHVVGYGGGFGLFHLPAGGAEALELVAERRLQVSRHACHIRPHLSFP